MAAPPDVTVIIRTIGTCRPWLEEAVASATAHQPGVRVEVIVVADGVDIPPVVHPAVQWAALPVNLGLAAARNAGLARAHGEWVRMLDDDDQLPPGALAAQVAAARASGADGVVGPIAGIPGEPTHPSIAAQRAALAAAWDGHPEHLGAVVARASETLVPPPTLLWRRAFNLRVPDDYVTADDNAAVRLLVASGGKLHYAADPVVLWYRVRSNSNSHQDAYCDLVAERVRSARLRADLEVEARRTSAPLRLGVVDWRMDAGGAQWALAQLTHHFDRRLVEPTFLLAEDGTPLTSWLRAHNVDVRVKPASARMDDFVVEQSAEMDALDVAWAAQLVPPDAAQAVVGRCFCHVQSSDLRWSELSKPGPVSDRYTRFLAVAPEVVAANPHLADRAVVIPSPVDTLAIRRAASQRAEWRRRLGARPGQHVVVWAGRPNAPTKRIDIMDAVARMTVDDPRFHWVVATAGSIPADVRQKWLGLFSRPNVCWLDNVPPWRMPSVYAAADGYFAPSMQEGLSLAMLEAMAAGCWLALTQVSGVAFAVPAGVGERLPLPPADPDQAAADFLAAIERLVGRPPEVQAAERKLLRHWASARFDVREAAARHAATYRWGV